MVTRGRGKAKAKAKASKKKNRRDEEEPSGGLEEEPYDDDEGSDDSTYPNESSSQEGDDVTVGIYDGTGQEKFFSTHHPRLYRQPCVTPDVICPRGGKPRLYGQNERPSVFFQCPDSELTSETKTDVWVKQIVRKSLVGSNILLYGLGSFNQILSGVVNCFERYTDYIMYALDGLDASFTFKRTLYDILTDGYGLDLDLYAASPSALLQELFNLFTTTSTRKARQIMRPLLLVIRSFDGPYLLRYHKILAHMANIPQITLIATVNNLRYGEMWDEMDVKQFRFIRFHCTSYHPMTAEEESLMTAEHLTHKWWEKKKVEKATEEWMVESFVTVLSTLSPPHWEVMLTLLDLLLDSDIQNSKKWRLVSFDDLLKKMQELRMMDRARLNGLLREFESHDIIFFEKGRKMLGVRTQAPWLWRYKRDLEDIREKSVTQ